MATNLPMTWSHLQSPALLTMAKIYTVYVYKRIFKTALLYSNVFLSLSLSLLSSIPTQPMNYSNPVYAKIYIDGQNCRKPVISIDERRELLPKKLEGTIHETAA